MGFVALICGVGLWWGAHLFGRVLPDQRVAMGDKGRGLVALLIGLSIVIMILGYRAAPFVHVWAPPLALFHINNLLVLIAIWMMSPAGQKGRILNRIRHPMLVGLGIWAIAHLLVNGDAASILLFGGLLIWAGVEVVVINTA
ncbi:MAG: NnrU family protein, partial [Pseudomonadota bacterium]